MARPLFILAVLAIVCSVSFSAHAAKNDLALWRLCQRGADGWCVPSSTNSNSVVANQDGFNKFAKQFAAVMAPKFHAPAESLGYAGFDLGFEFSVNQIPGGEHWDDALEGVERYPSLNYGGDKSSSAPGVLNTVRFHARKGLPYSLELGFNVNYLLNSEMFTLGGEFKFSFFEGFKWIPDFAVRATYDHLFNSSDLEMDLWGWDLSISKNFGLGGFIQLAPYTGYSIVLARAVPHVLNPSFDPYNNGSYLKLDGVTEPIHRWFLGLRILAANFNFTPEIVITSEKVFNYSFHVGVDF